MSLRERRARRARPRTVCSTPSPPAGPTRSPTSRSLTGSVVDGALLAGDVEDAFDYVVIGSGAAGAVAAHVLARSGASVAIVEEGPWVRTRQFGERVYDAFRRMFRDAGMQVIEGRAYIPLLQGRCVGGSTVVNSAIAHRTPEDVLDEWRRFGLGGADHGAGAGAALRRARARAQRSAPCPTRRSARTTAGSSTRRACTACPRGGRIATSTAAGARGAASRGARARPSRA